MSLTVRGLKGDLHDFFYDDDTSVADVKSELERLEAVPFEQLVLIHAGRELTNDLNLRRQGLTQFNQSNEILIDLQVRNSPQKFRACQAGYCTMRSHVMRQCPDPQWRRQV